MEDYHSKYVTELEKNKELKNDNKLLIQTIDELNVDKDILTEDIQCMKKKIEELRQKLFNYEMEENL